MLIKPVDTGIVFTGFFYFIGRRESMIDKETFHPLNYIKKEEYSGSMDGMRYLLKKVHSEETDTDVIRVTVWPEPFNCLRTPKELKTTIEVPLNTEGTDQAADWLNEQYETRKEYWLEQKNRPWTER
jgi:hypothetical protein